MAGKSPLVLEKAWEEPKLKRETHPHLVDLYERDIMFYVVQWLHINSGIKLCEE